MLCTRDESSSQSLGAALGNASLCPGPGGAGAQGGRTHTCRDDTIHISRLVFLAKKVRSGRFQLLVIAGHHCHMVDLVGSHMLYGEKWNVESLLDPSSKEVPLG